MEYVLIGKIAAAHGLDGHVLFRHVLDQKKAVERLKHVFIELHRESYIPYFIEEQKGHTLHEVMLLLDEVNSIEAAKTLTGKNVYIEAEVYRKLMPKAVHEGMEGFIIHDEQLGVIGPVESLMETPGQVLAAVTYQGKEVLIPLVEATIVRVDAQQKMLWVRLPDGLLDVYLT